MNAAVEPAANLQWSTPTEARQRIKEIRLIEQQLRLIKREARNVMKTVRAQAVAKGKTMKRRPYLFSPKLANLERVQNRELLRQEAVNSLVPYDVLCTYIDKHLVRLEKKRLDINRWLVQQPTR